MKTIKAIKFLSIALLTLGLSSCRNNDTPEDVHEHEEVNKIKVTYTNTSTKITQEAVFQTGLLYSEMWKCLYRVNKLFLFCGYLFCG